MSPQISYVGDDGNRFEKYQETKNLNAGASEEVKASANWNKKWNNNWQQALTRMESLWMDHPDSVKRRLAGEALRVMMGDTYVDDLAKRKYEFHTPVSGPMVRFWVGGLRVVVDTRTYPRNYMLVGELQKMADDRGFKYTLEEVARMLNV